MSGYKRAASDPMRWERFSKWITTTRIEKGLTQHEAAQAAGLNSAQLWSRYENKRSAFQRNTVKNVAKGLGVNESHCLKEAGYKVSTFTEENILHNQSNKERWEEFSRWLQWERKSRVLTQENAGAKAGKTGQWWSYYENGHPAIRQTVCTLAVALGIPSEEALMAAGYSLEDLTYNNAAAEYAIPATNEECYGVLLASQAAIRVVQLASQGKIPAEDIEKFLSEYEA